MSIPVHCRVERTASVEGSFRGNSLTFKTFARLTALPSPAGRLLASSLRQQMDMAQRSIEIFIGRVITDEGFRAAFRRDAIATLRGFVESGYELTPVEIAALVATAFQVWERAAEQLDARLQKVALTAAPAAGRKATHSPHSGISRLSGNREEERCPED